MGLNAIQTSMRTAATGLLRGLDDDLLAATRYPFDDDAVRRWIEYRPRDRPGVSLADLDGRSRKAAHRLLATGLSPHAYAQAMTIIGLEEVLDRFEGWHRGRHSNDYRVVVFGDPERDERWGWRFEGHHISVTMTLVDDRVYPTPVFLGANPASVSYAGRPVVRPLAPEEDLARALLDAMGPHRRRDAIVSGSPPEDIRSEVSARAGTVEPYGVPATRLNPTARSVLDQLVAVYLSRLPEELAEELTGQEMSGLHFAWEGSLRPGTGHYYRIQGPDLLIEYDNQQDDANHAHTVLRRPDSDFGGDVLAAHHTEAHQR
jgi:Protein of unknown function (DUF3500)